MDKKLFDRDLNANPALTRRIPHGTPDDPAENSTISQFISVFTTEMETDIKDFARENSGGVNTKPLIIGTWNMFTTASVSIAHGLTLADIVAPVNIVIRSNDGNLFDFINPGQNGPDGRYKIDATHITLYRKSGGDFYNGIGSDNFSTDAVYNRGYITIGYVV